MAVFREINVKAVTVREGRLRPLDLATVDALTESMKAIGLIQPITIHAPNGVMNFLVTGYHRLEAAKKLKWKTITAIVVPQETSEDDIKLSEIDENLARAELSEPERAMHIGMRKAIYERQHPETKHGATGRKGKKDVKFTSFSGDTAAKTGRSKSSIAKDATRAKKIPQIADTVGTCLAKGTELDALAKLSIAEQAVLIAKAKAGEKVTAKKPKVVVEQAAAPVVPATTTAEDDYRADCIEAAEAMDLWIGRYGALYEQKGGNIEVLRSVAALVRLPVKEMADATRE